MHVASAYTMEVRYFVCPSCGAPVDVSPGGGTAKCRFCSVQSHVAPRGASLPLPPPRMSEPERLKVLLAQASDKMLSPPTRIERLFSRGSATGLWNRDEVLAAWQSARKRTTEKHHDAAEELLFLTLILGNEFVEKHDWIGHRALLESAFESFFLPQHRSVAASDMATGACRQNDLAGAKMWLAQCDPISEVLYADSHFRSARAAVAHLEGNCRDVLVTLGMKTGEVPIHASLRDVCTVSRAHALEQMGALPDAIHELELRMGEGPQERRAVEQIAGLRSRCTRSVPIASAAVRQRASIVAANTAGGVEPTGLSALFGGGRSTCGSKSTTRRFRRTRPISTSC